MKVVRLRQKVHSVRNDPITVSKGAQRSFVKLMVGKHKAQIGLRHCVLQVVRKVVNRHRTCMLVLLVGVQLSSDYRHSGAESQAYTFQSIRTDTATQAAVVNQAAY